MTKEKLAEILAAHALWLAMKGGSHADLRDADLRDADLSDADLSGADLRSADLRSADLSGANLSSADLRSADLSSADLSGANLRSADLSGANLSGANLRSADLSGANLRSADLSGADLSEHAKAQLLTCPQTGAFEAWKICQNKILVRLLVPATAKRSSATGRKCRAEFIKVLEVIGGKVGISKHDGTTEYRKGKTVRCDKWEENRWIECGGGIHFFITRQEAENYQ